MIERLIITLVLIFIILNIWFRVKIYPLELTNRKNGKIRAGYDAIEIVTLIFIPLVVVIEFILSIIRLISN